MLCVPYYAMGYFGDRRVENVIWLTFLALMTANIIYTLNYYKVIQYLYRCTIWRRYNQTIEYVGIVLCLCGILLWPNSHSVEAVSELKDGTAAKYAATFDDRLLRQATTDRACLVEGLNYSSLLYFDDISYDINDWRNVAWTDYYGKQVFALGTPEKEEIGQYINALRKVDLYAVIEVFKPKLLDDPAFGNEMMDIGVTEETFTGEPCVILVGDDWVQVLPDAFEFGVSMDTKIGKYAFYDNENEYAMYMDNQEWITGMNQDKSAGYIVNIMSSDWMTRVQSFIEE